MNLSLSKCKGAALPNLAAPFLMIGLVVGSLFTGSLLAGCQKTSPDFHPPQETGQDVLSVLFIGNSHSRPMPGQLKKLFSKLAPDRKVDFRSCSAPFLATHANSQKTIDLIKSRKWDFVVLQGQKYSTSGKYHYPYDGSLKLSRIVKESTDAKLIMFPEWSRQQEPDEYLRINKIHDEIAEKTGATVAPVGKAWRMAITEFPDLKFHAADGNHARSIGNYLTACVFYALLTGESPVDDASNATRIRLAEIARQVVRD